MGEHFLCGSGCRQYRFWGQGLGCRISTTKCVSCWGVYIYIHTHTHVCTHSATVIQRLTLYGEGFQKGEGEVARSYST